MRQRHRPCTGRDLSPLVRADGVHRQVKLVGDLGHGQAGWQVAQHAVSAWLSGSRSRASEGTIPASPSARTGEPPVPRSPPGTGAGCRRPRRGARWHAGHGARAVQACGEAGTGRARGRVRRLRGRARGRARRRPGRRARRGRLTPAGALPPPRTAGPRFGLRVDDRSADHVRNGAQIARLWQRLRQCPLIDAGTS